MSPQDAERLPQGLGNAGRRGHVGEVRGAIVLEQAVAQGIHGHVQVEVAVLVVVGRAGPPAVAVVGRQRQAVALVGEGAVGLAQEEHTSAQVGQEHIESVVAVEVGDDQTRAGPRLLGGRHLGRPLVGPGPSQVGLFEGAQRCSLLRRVTRDHAPFDEG